MFRDTHSALLRRCVSRTLSNFDTQTEITLMTYLFYLLSGHELRLLSSIKPDSVTKFSAEKFV